MAKTLKKWQYHSGVGYCDNKEPFCNYIYEELIFPNELNGVFNEAEKQKYEIKKIIMRELVYHEPGESAEEAYWRLIFALQKDSYEIKKMEDK